MKKSLSLSGRLGWTVRPGQFVIEAVLACLLSARSSHNTGQLNYVDGGYHLDRAIKKVMYRQGKFFLTLILIFLLCKTTTAQNGKVMEKLKVASMTLQKEMTYSVYLPTGYDTSERSYPVLYLLHGLGDDDTGWIQFGEIAHIADDAIRNGLSTPIIIIMPDAGATYYVNAHDGKTNYEDYFFKELIPTVESKLKIRASKKYRTVAGLSMGGYGSLVYGLKHPEMFSTVASMSAAIRTEEEIESIDQVKFHTMPISRVFGGNVAGTNRITKTWKDYSVLNLIMNSSREDMQTVKWYIACGDDDALLNGNVQAHLAFKKADVPHEFRVSDGAHNWTYWRAQLPSILHFISGVVHQK